MAYTDLEVRYLWQMETFRGQNLTVQAVNEGLLENIAETLFEYGVMWGTPRYRRDSLGRVIGAIPTRRIIRDGWEERKFLGKKKKFLSLEEKYDRYMQKVRDQRMKDAMDAYEMPMPEGAKSIEAPPAPPAVDDFETLKRTLLDKDGKVIETKPKSLDPCPTCGNLHPADKFPICVCVKCLRVGQIVWCGQCMQCAWKEFADRFGEEAGDAMFPKYGEWRKKEAERLAKEGMPWDVT